jgi:hypothetical protein
MPDPFSTATSIAGFVQEQLSRAKSTYLHTEYKAVKAAGASGSLGAKGLIGYQEKYVTTTSPFKLNFGCTFEKYNAWKLTGEINNGKLICP